jgi:hypothetical protein
VRVSEELLNTGKNLDSKRTLNVRGRDEVSWIFRDMQLPANVLLHMEPEDLDAISGAGSPTRRVAELFRRAEGRVVGRGVVRTVARQKDYMKRIRQNGGARDHLTPEGYLVLGGHLLDQRATAIALGLPEPSYGEFVSVRVTRVERGTDRRTAFDARGVAWARTGEGDRVGPADFAFSVGDKAN